MLLIADQERYRVRSYAATGLEIPYRFAGLRIERKEISFGRSAEHQPAPGREHAGPRRRVELEFPSHFAGGCIERPNRTPDIIVRQLALAATGEERPRLIVGLALEISRARLAHRDIKQSGGRAIGWAEPNRSAIQVRPHQRPFV